MKKAVLAATMMAASAPAGAAVTMTFTQVGSDVVLSGSGSYDLTGATILGSGAQDGFVNPSGGSLAVGGPFANVTAYTLVSNGGTLGTGSYIDGFPDAGQVFGLDAAANFLTVYNGYVSLSSLSGSTTFVGQTIESLGLNPGTYVYSLPNDTLTVVVPGAVPEPASWAMMLMGFGAVGGMMRSRRRGPIAVA